MESFLNKKYKLVQRDENFNNYLKAIGLSWIETKFANRFPTVTELTKTEDGFFHLKTNVKIFTCDQKFQPHVEMQQKSVEGNLVKNIFWIEGDRLIEKQFGAKNVTITRQFSATGIKATLNYDNVTTKTYSEFVSQ